MSERPWVRPTSRVLVLAPDGRLLLLGARYAGVGLPPTDVRYWYAPGGGVEDGESTREAGARELAEEVGLVVDPALLEGPVWLRRHVVVFDGLAIDFRETYYVLRDVVHEVDDGGRTEGEKESAEPHRWWSTAEMAAGDVEFAPRALPALLPHLLSGPWTGPPIVVDV